MTSTTDARDSFGQYLVDHCPDPQGLPDDLEVPDGRGLVAAAAATPFLTRLCLLLPALRQPGGLPVDAALVRVDAYARNQDDDVLGGRRGYATTVLGLALDASLLGLVTDNAASRVVPGEQADLITDHPLAAWGEALEPLLFGDHVAELAATPRWHDQGMLPVLALLYQLLVKSLHPVRLDPVVRGLLAEITAAADGRTPPTRSRVARQLGLFCTLLREFGLADWQPEGRARLGSAAVTPLGLFGWTVFMTTMDGPTEQMKRHLAEAGYLEVGDGRYVNTADLPVPPVWN